MFTITETTPTATTKRLPQFRPVEEMMEKVAFKAITIIYHRDMGLDVAKHQGALTRMVNTLVGMHSSNSIRKNYPTTIRKMARKGFYTEEQIEELYMTLQGRLGII